MIEEAYNNWNVGKLEYSFGSRINISMSIKDIDNYYIKIYEKSIPLFKELMINKYDVNNEIYEDKEFLIQDPD